MLCDVTNFEVVETGLYAWVKGSPAVIFLPRDTSEIKILDEGETLRVIDKRTGNIYIGPNLRK